MKQLLWTFFLLFILRTSSQTFSQYRAQMETNVKDIARSLQQKYDPELCTCAGNVFYDECVGINAPECYEQFPQHQKCFQPGVLMSQSHAYRLPVGLDKNNLTCKQASFMCNADASVPSFFKRISNKREYRFTKMFIGSVTGVFVSHPGSLEHCDSSYDPRLRPWYVIGSTAARNMVIFYKLKSSQNKPRAIDIADYLLNTTNSNDWLMAVDLNSCNNSGFCNTTWKGLSYHQNQSFQYIKNVEVKNKNWNYDLISNRANLLFSSVENKTRNIIILVSDTIPDEAEIQGQLDELSVYSPRFMPIILGNKNADLTDLEAVTCLSEGLLTHDKNKNQYIPDMMIEYSKYFTDNLNVNKPLWSPIYNDAFGFGLLVTVTMPVYSTNENGSFLIGVVGLDVTIEYLRQQYGLEQREIQSQFMNYLNYGQNDLICNCSLCLAQTEPTSTSSISWEQGKAESNVCCTIDKTGTIVLIVVFLLVFVAAIIGLVIFCLRRNEQDKTEITEKAPQESPRKKNQENANGNGNRMVNSKAADRLYGQD